MFCAYGCVGIGYGGSASYGGSAFYSSSQAYSSSGGVSDCSYSAPVPYVVPVQSLHFEAASFLNAERPAQPMVYRSDEIMDVVRDAFLKVTGTVFPDGIQLVVCDDCRFKSLHSEFGPWNEGIMGFSINKFGRGISEVFVRQAPLDSLMLTIGHEIGHVMSRTLPDAKDEEAKAHAFSLAWMEAISEHNIGGLRSNIMPNPANNGLHDVAFDFVKKLLYTGASPYDIFRTLAKGLASIVGGLT